MQNITLQQKVENFARLSDQECALFLQSHLLEALEIEEPTYLEWVILAKFISLEYVLRDDLCRLFNYFLKRNIQNIASIPVNAWLMKYLKKYAGVPRDPDTFFRYASADSEIRKLNEKDQIRLMRIFRLYDYFLIEPIASMDDVAAENIMRFPMYLSESLAEIKIQMSSAQNAAPKVSAGTISERIALKQAVQKYPKLGEQMVTNSPINLKNFDRPVRPSVRNWIYDYTSHLGQTGHTSMDRTEYLFKSENAMKLRSQEREKLGIMLKSFDENTPLGVDTENQVLIFENPKSEALNPKQYQNPNFQISRPAPAINRQIPKPHQQDFVKPYPKPETPRNHDSNPILSKVRPFDQSSTFPSRQQSSRDSSKSNFTENSLPAGRQTQGQTLSDSSKLNFAKPQQQTFVRSYPQTEIKPSLQPQPAQKTIPPAEEIQNSKFKIQNSAPSAAGMQFVNPYPKPGTHEPQFAETEDNISNVRFAEGLPASQRDETAKKSLPAGSPKEFVPPAPTKVRPSIQGSTFPPPQADRRVSDKSSNSSRLNFPENSLPAGRQARSQTPSDSPRPHHSKNLYSPHYGFREENPEPRIDGNIVDLSGRNDQ